MFLLQAELEQHLKDMPSCQQKPFPPKCRVCKVVFSSKSDLHAHLSTSTECTTILGAAATTSLEPTSKISASKVAVGANPLRPESILSAMERGIRGSGSEFSILGAIAEGDEEDVEAYTALPVHETTGKRLLTKEFVSSMAAKSRNYVRHALKAMRKAQNVSLCFLLDTTGSMAGHINGVKSQIADIVRQVELCGCGIAGIAFVGYKDWCDGVDHFEILQFTTNTQQFRQFLDGITATGGGDYPEDVLGGIQAAVNLNWPVDSSTRIIFHMGDAPPHGNPYYHSHHDTLPKGHPSDPKLRPLFGAMRARHIDYHFGKIGQGCDLMIKRFQKYYHGGTIDVADTSMVERIASSVSSAVSASVSMSLGAEMSKLKLDRKNTRHLTFEEAVPVWESVPSVLASIVQYELPETIDEITSFTALKQSIRHCKIKIAQHPFAKGGVRAAYYGQLQYGVGASAGAECGSALKAGAIATVSSESGEDETPSGPASQQNQVVLKEFLTPSAIIDLDRMRYMVALEVQTVAAKLAFEFNNRIHRVAPSLSLRLKFLMAKVVRVKKSGGTDDESSYRYLAMEKQFHGRRPDFVKYTSNLNYVLPTEGLDETSLMCREVAVAFQHFTHQHTNRYLMVCDLQGVLTGNESGRRTLLLTDPAIHCPTHARFGKTNLQHEGVKAFYSHHVCNDYCHALGLTSSATVIGDKNAAK